MKKNAVQQLRFMKLISHSGDKWIDRCTDGQTVRRKVSVALRIGYRLYPTRKEHYKFENLNRRDARQITEATITLSRL